MGAWFHQSSSQTFFFAVDNVTTLERAPDEGSHQYEGNKDTKVVVGMI